MTEQIFLLDMAPDAQRLLADNGIDLVRALREQGISVTRVGLPRGVPDLGGGKDLVLTILAVGISASLIAAGVAKVLDALGRNRKFPVTERKLVPVTTDSGDLVRNETGEPVLYWSEEHRLVEAAQTEQDRSSSSLAITAGPILLKFGTKSGK